MLTKLFSLLLALAVVGGGIYLVQATDKIPDLNNDRPHAITTDNAAPGAIITDQAIERKTDGSIVKCVESGKITYSDSGCKNGINAKTVEMHHAAGIVSPSRETINYTLARMRADRIAEDRNAEAMAAQNQERKRLNAQKKADTCAALERQINSLDAMARQNSTNWIRDERLKARSEQFEIHC